MRFEITGDSTEVFLPKSCLEQQFSKINWYAKKHELDIRRIRCTLYVYIAVHCTTNNFLQIFS